MNKNLYNSVKFVIGEGFVTIEETGTLSDCELMELSNQFVRDPNFKEVKNLTLLVPAKFGKGARNYIKNRGFKPHDEVYFVQKDLQKGWKECGHLFQLRPLGEVHEAVFKEIWHQSMEGSLNAPQSLNMDEQMESVKKEIGPSYISTCLTVYEKGQPIGVVMPHIEPGTTEEGRIFYFGLIPEARGKGKSTAVYSQGLALLKDKFGASYSVGATSIHNKPMLRVFEKCGFDYMDKVTVYKRSLQT
ncbi:Acetyltransferase (GNAT) domain-containing protein [Halobacillus dabanensis]|uniref:Acetyltransferase (GNAT) domain-containing protein n=1 Tax=Halobacillus dabanensis TaxID=240302 RepID=A0A1I3ZCB5_HALDA|nr:GNAT family N-acetyltransferase [Halobacillus dabanensis]SFK41246.1 Acetyltransferase (GNAT) domain-containing protein [Halobacillus dabanensis]